MASMPNPMATFALTGQVIAVTGAGQGIGRALALHFAAAGARLVLADVNAEAVQAVQAELRAAGHQAIAVATDVRSAAACQHLVAQGVEAFGRLDVMVCNAGVVLVKPFMELSDEDWDPLLSVNVKGAFFCMQAAARQMQQQPALAPGRPRGKIINMASIAGRYGGGPVAAFLAPYRASKAAVISLTQTAAHTLAPDITVNAICPGLVATDMWKRMDSEFARLQNGQEGEAFARRVSAVPLGRAQTPEDVARLAVFLASAGSDYMTGQSVNVDGGLVLC